MSIFITGATGYIGSYVAHFLLRDSNERLALLIRAQSRNDAEAKLWRAMQLHVDVERFHELLPRIDFVYGDLTSPGLGIRPAAYDRLVRTVESVIHIAASLNRKSEKACLNTNLRGTLSVVKLARHIADFGGLRRFSHVSTVAVSGRRDRELVTEDRAIDWDRSDYDPYGRTKKYCEHMVRELLPDTPLTFFRPAIVMGDSRRPETTQFDMVKTFCFFADMPVVPMREDARVDIVNADFVGRAIADLHRKQSTEHEIYHLSSGLSSRTAGEIAYTFAKRLGRRPPRFVKSLERPFFGVADALDSMPKGSRASSLGALLKVFLPYITYDTVFDNTRVTRELGYGPTPFTDYCAALYVWANRMRFRYPYLELPTPSQSERAPISEVPLARAPSSRFRETPQA